MAETGKSITRANFTSLWTAEYSDSTKTNSNTPEWYYVSAFSFVTKCYADKHWETTFGANPALIVTCDCYDWATKKWSRVFHRDYISYTPQNGQIRYQLKFYHNRDAETDDSSYLNYRDTDTSRKTALFRFRLERNTGSEDAATGIHIWLGGIGTLTDAEYNTYVKGRPIASNGQMGSAADNFVWYGGRVTEAPDAKAIAKFNPENTKGQFIRKEYEYNCVPKWF